MIMKFLFSVLIAGFFASGTASADQISEQLERQRLERNDCLDRSERAFEAAKAKKILRQYNPGTHTVGEGAYKGCGDNGCDMLCFMLSNGRADCVNKANLGWYPGLSKCPKF